MPQVITVLEEELDNLPPGARMDIQFSLGPTVILTDRILALLKESGEIVTGYGSDVFIIKLVSTKVGQLSVEHKYEQRVSVNQNSECKLTKVSSGLHSVLKLFMPQWFLEQFGKPLLDDLIQIAKEEGGSTWQLTLLITVLGFVFKFAWRRFERRRGTETSGRSPSDRNDEP